MAMRTPAVPNRMDRRILILYRFAPDLAERILRPSYQPRKLSGCVLGGIALVRCVGVHSRLLPARIIACENALHFINGVRIEQQRAETGVLVMRYDTSSRLHAWMGGERRWHCRHHHARFCVVESPDAIDICCDSDDLQVHVAMKARVARSICRQSVFRSTDQVLHQLQHELRCLGLTRRDTGNLSSSRPTRRSQLIPLSVERLESSIFSDAQQFPSGSVEFDSAFWLRDDELVWSDEEAICCDVATA